MKGTMKIYLDSNVLIASCVADHPHFAQAAALVTAIREHQHTAWISTHGLAETYSVLTRLPLSPPIFPGEAWRMLIENILSICEVIALTTKDYRKVLEQCAQTGISGGRVYDVLHLQAAHKEGCERLYTFNVRHFRELVSDWTGEIAQP